MERGSDRKRVRCGKVGRIRRMNNVRLLEVWLVALKMLMTLPVL